MPVARADRALHEIDAAPLSRRFAEHQRGPRRRVDLFVMVHFQHLDIVVIAKRTCDLPHRRQQQIDAKTEIPGFDNDRVLGGFRDLLVVGGRKTRGANHVNDPGLCGKRREFNRCRRNGEVDDCVNLVDHGQRIIGNRHQRLADASQKPCIFAKRQKAFPLDRAGKLRSLGPMNGAYERQPHPPRRPHHRDLHSVHFGGSLFLWRRYSSGGQTAKHS